MNSLSRSADASQHSGLEGTPGTSQLLTDSCKHSRVRHNSLVLLISCYSEDQNKVQKSAITYFSRNTPIGRSAMAFEAADLPTLATVTKAHQPATPFAPSRRLCTLNSDCAQVFTQPPPLLACVVVPGRRPHVCGKKQSSFRAGQERFVVAETLAGVENQRRHDARTHDVGRRCH